MQHILTHKGYYRCHLSETGVGLSFPLTASLAQADTSFALTTARTLGQILPSAST